MSDLRKKWIWPESPVKARLSENMKVPLTINHSLTIQHMIGIRFDNMLNQTSIVTFLDSNEATGGFKV